MKKPYSKSKMMRRKKRMAKLNIKRPKRKRFAMKPTTEEILKALIVGAFPEASSFRTK